MQNKLQIQLEAIIIRLMVSSMDMLDNLESIINIFDEPFSDSSFIPIFLISKLASSHVKMVLSGDGGDEMFLGYNRYIVANKILKIKKYFQSFFRKAFSMCLKNDTILAFMTP